MNTELNNAVLQLRIEEAIKLIVKYGGTDDDHHKAWVLDQVIREIYPVELTSKESDKLRRMGFHPESDTFYLSPGKCATILAMRIMDKKRNNVS